MWTPITPIKDKANRAISTARAVAELSVDRFNNWINLGKNGDTSNNYFAEPWRNFSIFGGHIVKEWMTAEKP